MYTSKIGILFVIFPFEANLNFSRRQMRLSILGCLGDLGCFPLTSPRRQRRRQTWQRLFTLPKLPSGDVLSIRGNSGNAGDTGFAGEMESVPRERFTFKMAI